VPRLRRSSRRLLLGCQFGRYCDQWVRGCEPVRELENFRAALLEVPSVRAPNRLSANREEFRKLVWDATGSTHNQDV